MATVSYIILPGSSQASINITDCGQHLHYFEKESESDKKRIFLWNDLVAAAANMKSTIKDELNLWRLSFRNATKTVAAINQSEINWLC